MSEKTWKAVEAYFYDDASKCPDCPWYRVEENVHPYGSTTAVETFNRCALLETIDPLTSPDDCMGLS